MARTPLAKAAISGTLHRNPGRFQGRQGPKHTRPIGDPYTTMSEAERAYWHELTEELPWLHSAHRTLLRLTCRLAARLDSGEEFGGSATQALSSLLTKLGATPVDAGKVAQSDGGDANDDWFRRHLS